MWLINNHHWVNGFELLNIYNLATAGSYTIEMNDITFRNISSDRESKLMYLQHQLDNPVVINNLNINDINFAGISVESYDSNQFGNETKVIINNMNASNVNGKSRSLFQINTGANVEVTGATIYYVNNYDEGAVMHAAKENAIGIFRSSNFYNNTSIEGGVFSSEHRSDIKWYDWQFTNNFALTSGVFKVGGDGMFEAYNSIFTKNKGLNTIISEIFSTQLQSIVNNCTFTENIKLSSAQVSEEILTQGN